MTCRPPTSSRPASSWRCSTANSWDPRWVCCSTFPFDHCDAVLRGPLGRYLHYIGVEIKTGMTAQSLTLSERHWSEGALSLSTSVTFAPVSGADIPADALVWPHGTRRHDLWNRPDAWRAQRPAG
jgi:hypothetical protein